MFEKIKERILTWELNHRNYFFNKADRQFLKRKYKRMLPFLKYLILIVMLIVVMAVLTILIYQLLETSHMQKIINELSHYGEMA